MIMMGTRKWDWKNSRALCDPISPISQLYAPLRLYDRNSQTFTQ